MKNTVVKQVLLPAILTIGISAPLPALAGSGDIAFGIKGGTIGVGGEMTVGLSDKLNFRTGYNVLNYDGNATACGVDYDYKLKFRSMPLLLDLHPFGNGFRVTSGLFINNNEVSATAYASGDTIKIGNTTYNAANLGTLDVTVDFDTAAPYLGIGWGNAVDKKSRLTVSFDAGIMFQGKSRVSFDPSIDTSLIPGLNENIELERAELENDLKRLRYFPVISLGLAYRF